MGMGQACGALLEAIVATRAWVPLPIPGSMITDLKLKAYIMIEAHAPDSGLTYATAASTTIISIDDLTASMVTAHYVRTSRPAVAEEGGVGYTYIRRSRYSPEYRVPYLYHVYAPKAPANRRNYKHRTFKPIELAQREEPHVNPAYVGVIPWHKYNAFERLPVQRTAALSFMTPPPLGDTNPHDLDTIEQAALRSEIINVHVHYP